MLNLSFLIFKEKIKFEIDVIGQNAVKIFKKFAGMSIQYLANLTAEERIFVRQFKLVKKYLNSSKSAKKRFWKIHQLKLE